MQKYGLVIEDLTGDAIRVAPQGELDLVHAYLFDEELRRVEARQPQCVVLDLRELRFLDSCGVSRLIAARRRAQRAGRRLLLIRGPTAVQRLLSLAAVDESFETVSEIPVNLTRYGGQ